MCHCIKLVVLWLTSFWSNLRKQSMMAGVARPSTNSRPSWTRCSSYCSHCTGTNLSQHPLKLDGTTSSRGYQPRGSTYKGKDVPQALLDVQKGCRSNPVNRRNHRSKSSFLIEAALNAAAPRRMFMHSIQSNMNSS
jgi:hypothetical protein